MPVNESDLDQVRDFVLHSLDIVVTVRTDFLGTFAECGVMLRDIAAGSSQLDPRGVRASFDRKFEQLKLELREAETNLRAVYTKAVRSLIEDAAVAAGEPAVDDDSPEATWHGTAAFIPSMLLGEISRICKLQTIGGIDVGPDQTRSDPRYDWFVTYRDVAELFKAVETAEIAALGGRVRRESAIARKFLRDRQVSAPVTEVQAKGGKPEDRHGTSGDLTREEQAIGLLASGHSPTNIAAEEGKPDARQGRASPRASTGTRAIQAKEGKPEDRQGTSGDLTREEQALGLLANGHSPKEIASRLGVHRSTLYTWPRFKQANQFAREAKKAGQSPPPRGWKNANGEIDAWADEDVK